MKNIHRSEKLDAFLNHKVTIFFTDGSIEQGVLFWNDKPLTPPLYLCKQGYYLEQDTCCLGFSKSYVKKIENYEKFNNSILRQGR